MKVASHSFFEYCIPVLLLCVDISLFGFLQQHVIFTLICWYILQLTSNRSFGQLTWILLLLATQSTLLYGRFGLELIYLIPLSILVLKIKPYIGWQFVLIGATLTACLLLQTYVLQTYLLGFSITGTYTATKIIGNLIVIEIISLKQYLIR